MVVLLRVGVIRGTAVCSRPRDRPDRCVGRARTGPDVAGRSRTAAGRAGTKPDGDGPGPGPGGRSVRPAAFPASLRLRARPKAAPGGGAGSWTAVSAGRCPRGYVANGEPVQRRGPRATHERKAPAVGQVHTGFRGFYVSAPSRGGPPSRKAARASRPSSGGGRVRPVRAGLEDVQKLEYV
jgi:hypothetical protein